MNGCIRAASNHITLLCLVLRAAASFFIVHLQLSAVYTQKPTATVSSTHCTLKRRTFSSCLHRLLTAINIGSACMQGRNWQFPLLLVSHLSLAGHNKPESLRNEARLEAVDAITTRTNKHHDHTPKTNITCKINNNPTINTTSKHHKQHEASTFTISTVLFTARTERVMEFTSRCFREWLCVELI